jgi:protein-tyrosine-phosphatase
MAEAIFRNMVDCKKDIEVSSAALYGYSDMPTSRKATAVMAKRGLDITSMRSRKLNRKIVDNSDIIVTMESEQRDIIREQYGHSNVFTLREIAGERGDIEDPLGSPLAVYEKCADEIERLLARGLNRILT